MDKVKDKLYRFMVGRYGNDKLNQFLLIVSMILLLLNAFVFKNQLLVSFLWVVLLVIIFRTYSRNIYARRNENEKFLNIVAPVSRRIKVIQKNFNDKEHKYFICPNCHQFVRVPKGRGKITITCPKCKEKFDRKS